MIIRYSDECSLISTTHSEAHFSDCETYRYSLTRIWEIERPRHVFIMLNPSSADEKRNDPTVQRVETRVRIAGGGGYTILNLFALRSTDPKLLYSHADPVGAENDRIILDEASTADQVVIAWGNHGKFMKRSEKVKGLLDAAGITYYALRISETGQPSHPLYLPYTLQPFVFRQAA